MELAIQAIIVGVVATIAIDLWALLLKSGLGLPTTNWGMVGRWFGHLPSGVWVHSPISDSQAIAYEHVIGWVAHYVIGVVYAFIYLYAVTNLMLVEPTLISATVFGVATVLVPWFVLQPGLGLGVFAHRSPRANVIRLMSLSIHTIFGLALYFGWWLAR